ncbi:MAG: oligosaccharide flippase family protein [Planctomycetes bacterium]|jgi:O-antigen/teichoic acid export membrane protein|nr:oligosaccharide flippase family protein [Planctomycetota bacterium]
MSPAGGDLRQRTLQSLFWQFLGVGGQRIVQLCAPIVLWRVLEEGDLGLFAILLAAIGVVESLTTFTGEQTSIWSQRGAERRYIDTVFTVRLLRSVCISAILCALAWPFAWYFGKPETAAKYWLPGLFLVLAGNGLIDALQSPARAARMKGLDFRRVALGDFVAALLGVGITIGLALWLRSVWAMVLGHLFSTAARTIASHVVAPHRLRLHLERATLHELFHYQKGAAGAPFLLLMIFTAPAFVLGKVIGEGAVAVFEGAARLAKLPEDIFLRVLAPVAVPAYAQLQHDIPRLGQAWSNAVHAFLLVGTPMTVALGWCGDALPSFAFGAKYIAVPGLFALLALHGGLAGLLSVIGPLFWAVGKPQWDRQAQLFRCLAMYGIGIPAAIHGGVLGFAAATCVAIGIGLVVSIWRALRYLRLPLHDFTHATRDGLAVGIGLLLLLLGIDAAWAPDRLWRIVIAGVTSGPLLAMLLLRLLRQRRGQSPELATPQGPIDAGNAGPL